MKRGLIAKQDSFFNQVSKKFMGMEIRESDVAIVTVSIE